MDSLGSKVGLPFGKLSLPDVECRLTFETVGANRASPSRTLQRVARLSHRNPFASNWNILAGSRVLSGSELGPTRLLHFGLVGLYPDLSLVFWSNSVVQSIRLLRCSLGLVDASSRGAKASIIWQLATVPCRHELITRSSSPRSADKSPIFRSISIR